MTTKKRASISALGKLTAANKQLRERNRKLTGRCELLVNNRIALSERYDVLVSQYEALTAKAAGPVRSWLSREITSILEGVLLGAALGYILAVSI